MHQATIYTSLREEEKQRQRDHGQSERPLAVVEAEVADDG